MDIHRVSLRVVDLLPRAFVQTSTDIRDLVVRTRLSLVDVVAALGRAGGFYTSWANCAFGEQVSVSTLSRTPMVGVLLHEKLEGEIHRTRGRRIVLPIAKVDGANAFDRVRLDKVWQALKTAGAEAPRDHGDKRELLADAVALLRLTYRRSHHLHSGRRQAPQPSRRRQVFTGGRFRVSASSSERISHMFGVTSTIIV